MNLFLFIWVSLSIFFTIYLYSKNKFFFNPDSIIDYFFIITLAFGLSIPITIYHMRHRNV
jgi:hypothetical protein